MIFRFTQNDLIRLKTVTYEQYAELKKLAATHVSQDGNAWDKEGIEQDTIKITDLAKKHVQKLEALEAEIEQEHFNAIKADHKAILEDAAGLIDDCIIYAYLQLYEEMQKKRQDENKKAPITVDLTTAVIPMGEEYTLAKSIDIQKDAARNKKDLLFYFSKNGLATFIKDNAIKLHLAELNEEEGAELLRTLDDTLTNSIYVNNDNLEGLQLYTPARRNALLPSPTYKILGGKTSNQMIYGTASTKLADGQFSMILGDMTRPAAHTTTWALMMDKYENLPAYIKNRIDMFDMSIISAIGSIALSQNEGAFPLRITTREIWAKMRGKDYNQKGLSPSQKQLNEIARRIEKMSFIRCALNITENIKDAYNKGDQKKIMQFQKAFPDTNFEIDDLSEFNVVINKYFLKAESAHVFDSKGKLLSGIYKIDEMPVIFNFSNAEGRLITTTNELIDMPFRMNENAFKFRDFLIKEIIWIASKDRKNPERQINNRLTIERIYEGASVPLPKDNYAQKQNRKREQQDRDMIEDILYYFCNNKRLEDDDHNFILRFRQVKGLKNKIIGYDIIPFSEKDPDYKNLAFPFSAKDENWLALKKEYGARF